MPLGTDIENWDGKSKADIRGVYDRYADSPTLLPDLIECARSAQLQKGATWLIKRYVEIEGPVDARTAADILGLVPGLYDWESKLHLLQCLPYVTIPARSRKAVEAFTRACIIADNKFVRAWGYGGFYELARRFPKYRAEADELMSMALRDEPASVRARVRKALAKGF